jgi:hypothetical protein
MMTEPICLWLPRLLLGVEAYFDLVGTSETFLYADYMRCMVGNHAWIKRGKHVAC